MLDDDDTFRLFIFIFEESNTVGEVHTLAVTNCFIYATSNARISTLNPAAKEGEVRSTSFGLIWPPIISGSVRDIRDQGHVAPLDHQP